jgi:hypothetical protein
MYLLQRASPGEIESQIIRLIRLIPNSLTQRVASVSTDSESEMSDSGGDDNGEDDGDDRVNFAEVDQWEMEFEDVSASES